MQMIIHAARQRVADAAHLVEIRDPGTHDALQATEVLQQRAPLGRPEARHRFEHRLVVALGAPAAMARDREPMRLVADALDEPRGRRMGLGDAPVTAVP